MGQNGVPFGVRDPRERTSLIDWIRRYARWLHTRWPAGRVENLPEVRPDGSTAVPGLWIAGDLSGVPLLKFALDSGARVAASVATSARRARPAAGEIEFAIVGAGVSGMAAALEAGRLGLACVVLEDAEPFATIADFPARKPIFTYPTSMTPAGPLQVQADVKEPLLEELRAQAAASGIDVRRARATHVAREAARWWCTSSRASRCARATCWWRSGAAATFAAWVCRANRTARVFHRLHDPKDFRGRDVIVAGGGDSAAEAAIALADAGARVTLVHRSAQLVRPSPANVAGVRERERAGRLDGHARNAHRPGARARRGARGRTRVAPRRRVRDAGSRSAAGAAAPLRRPDPRRDDDEPVGCAGRISSRSSRSLTTGRRAARSRVSGSDTAGSRSTWRSGLRRRAARWRRRRTIRAR